MQLTFSAGETTTTVTPQVPGGVSDGRWHSVQVQYYNKVGGAPPTPLLTSLRGHWQGPGCFSVLSRPCSET